MIHDKYKARNCWCKKKKNSEFERNAWAKKKKIIYVANRKADMQQWKERKLRENKKRGIKYIHIGSTKVEITYHLIKKQSQTPEKKQKHYVNPQRAATNDAISSCASAIRSMAFRIPTTSAITESNAAVWACFSERYVGARSAPSSKSTSSCLIVVVGPIIACSPPCVLLCCCGSLVLVLRPGTGGKMVGVASPLTFTPPSKCSEHKHSLSSTCLSETSGITASHSLHWMSSAVQTYSICDGSLSLNSLGQPLMLQVIAAVPRSIALEGVCSDSLCDSAWLQRATIYITSNQMMKDSYTRNAPHKKTSTLKQKQRCHGTPRTLRSWSKECRHRTAHESTEQHHKNIKTTDYM